MMPRLKFYRYLFAIAGFYNIAWGLYSALHPQWLFNFSDMPPARYPEIFSCLAMLVGLYGLLYLAVAKHPQGGRLIIGVGLLGKVLGPIGAIYLILSGAWPLRAIVLCVFNDFIWWIPFSMYLIDSRSVNAPEPKS